MISRQRLIDKVKYWHLTNTEHGVTWLPEHFVAEIIEALSQPPADQWIPCSRELPKMNQPIIGTYENDGRRIVVVDNYFPQLLSGPWRLIAWMPAESYKGVE